MKISLSQAWDEARGVLKREGRLIWPLAFAFLLLPSLIATQLLPVGPRNEPAPLALVGTLVTLLLGLTGQLAIEWLAIRPGEQVGDSIRRGLRAAPKVFAALMLVALPIALVIMPFLPSLQAGGEPSPAEAWLMLGLIALVLMVAARMLFAAPVAVAEQPGVIGLLKRSWQLTRGNSLRLYGFLMTFVIVLGIVSFAAGRGLGVPIIAALGQPTPWSVSAILLALVTELAQIAIAVPFTVMLARLYAQAVAGEGERPA